MKQKIGTMKSATEPITDLDVVFVAMYNLLYEKLEQEPNKGIVVSKGNPNQRKATWKEVLSIAHALEDFFVFRTHRTACRECQLCNSWNSTSEASSHIGECKERNIKYMHAFNSCRKFNLKGES